MKDFFMIKGYKANYSRIHFQVIGENIYTAIPPYYKVDKLSSPQPHHPFTELERITLSALHGRPLHDIAKLPSRIQEFYLNVRAHGVKYRLRGYKSIWKHNKNGKRYALIQTLTDKTSNNERTMVLYEDIGTRQKYVRDIDNFNQSFTELS